ncbi:sensor histidine kinase [Mangrovihabitans endophyticus]|uniref:histidine kinase n=1 Tax=Mangrovihabitans endophyticus TaxID=1751298 RepID=A0A8J3FN83_9ACTN|nr:histidine kinase [Mangrovihabitans endophyticus]GGK81897.1 two-component sensor histidine kinase [Mangrovihabitans endophyticus]
MNLDRLWTGFGRSIRRHPLLADALLALALAVVSVGIIFIDAPARALPAPDAGQVFAFVLALAAITIRRWFTLTSLVLVVAAAVVLLVLQHRERPALTIAVAVLTYTYATRADRRRGWIAAGLTATVLILADLLWHESGGDRFAIFLWPGIGAAAGDAARSHRAYIAEAEERARQAEQSRDEEVRLRVAEERMRVARELHDVVAHRIAAVKVQATGARHILTYRPEQVAPALDHISRLSDTVLREMGSVIGLLRHSANDAVPGNAPVPGLSRLRGLLDEFTTAGLHIRHRQVGAARTLPVLADLAAYRIIQEGLTNAHKYGDGAADLTVTYTAGGVTVDIRNTIGVRPAPHGTGYGVIGMSERVATTGGTFTAGPTTKEHYTVHAELSAPIVAPAR